MQLWFEEQEADCLRYGYRIDGVLDRVESPFQKIDILETRSHGRMMLIDGLVMLTEKDEFVYHEMIAHVPSLIHPDPKRVVVIGGGDGGTVRELLKHPSIESIVLCEIDVEVVNAAKKYFPKVSEGFYDPKVEVQITDGIQFVKELPEGSVDLLIVDSTDPIGPGEGLFTKDFYSDVARSLKEDGFMVCQSESPWQPQEGINRIFSNVGHNFNFVKPYIGSVPTYPRGLWSWTMASKIPFGPERCDRARLSSIVEGLHYLNEDVFHAAFALPNFYKRKIGYL